MTANSTALETVCRMAMPGPPDLTTVNCLNDEKSFGNKYIFTVVGSSALRLAISSHSDIDVIVQYSPHTQRLCDTECIGFLQQLRDDDEQKLLQSSVLVPAKICPFLRLGPIQISGKNANISHTSFFLGWFRRCPASYYLTLLVKRWIATLSLPERLPGVSIPLLCFNYASATLPTTADVEETPSAGGFSPVEVTPELTQVVQRSLLQFFGWLQDLTFPVTLDKACPNNKNNSKVKTLQQQTTTTGHTGANKKKKKGKCDSNCGSNSIDTNEALVELLAPCGVNVLRGLRNKKTLEVLQTAAGTTWREFKQVNGQPVALANVFGLLLE
eukprot:TRINITY_DN68427_c0_g1_i1.p1 TRINITY_DN68427_c0_g1~~TRINITY_DN68427_c0_g1_i1.p1  ORF type:complete len:328 (+),score=53.81 TRINITY_DN68427_c0_g1_i1:20-1003(+)